MNDRIDTSQWRQLGALFDQAVGMDSAGQADLLRAIERDDVDLAQALASLLAADARHHAHTSEQRDRVLQGSIAAIDAPGVAIGDRVGPYILREELGSGGMGVVFRAERADGQVQQEVALKIVRRTLLAASGRERFLREREIVAALQHPGIARMLDVGQTADGSPYMAMELIRGIPISDYCDAHKLDTRGRVEVFLRVCEAVQHAHANLVLHRDLKPSNVLVREDGLPALIDFGIAKPLATLANDRHQETATAHRFFSPSNAAPEQLRGERVGVACDVYQLGTLLYELLCGATVFDTRGITAGQLERKILEAAPEAPSARAARTGNAIAQAHGAVNPAAHMRELRGDLDAIVAHALRKLPHERYGSVEQLADDLRRYLVGQPVSAQRGLRWYRARKFLRRHVLAVAISTAAVALVAVFVSALWLQSQRIVRERNLTQQRSNDVEQVARFEADMLKKVDPAVAGKQLMDDLQAKLASALVKERVPESESTRQVAAFAALLQHVNATDAARDQIDRTTLKPAIAAIDKQFQNQPVVAATLRQVLADRYAEMGLFDAAMPLQQSALATRRRVLGEDHPDTLQSIRGMGELLLDQGKLAEAGPYLREAMEKRRRVLGEEHKDTIQSIADMGELLKSQDRMSEAEPYFREAIRKSRRVNGEESKDTLYLVGEMGALLDHEGKLSESELYLREAVAKTPRVLGKDDPDAPDFIDALAWALLQQGKLAEAEHCAREALERSRRDLGEDHPSTLFALYTLGNVLTEEEKLGEAEPYFREALKERRRVLGDEHADTLESMENLGDLLVEEGKLSEAEPFLRETLQKSRRVLGENDSTTQHALVALGSFLLKQGKLDQAEPYLREALETSRRAYGEHDPGTEAAIGKMGALLVAQRKYTEAEKLLAPFEAEARKPGTPYYRYSHPLILMDLGQARTALGEFPAAQSDLLEAQSAYEAKRLQPSLTRTCTQALIDLYHAWKVAEPGKGYDGKAAEWKRKLDALDALMSATAAR